MIPSAKLAVVYGKPPSASDQGIIPMIGRHLERSDDNNITSLLARTAYSSAVAIQEQRAIAYKAHSAKFPRGGYQPLETYSAKVTPISNHPLFNRVRNDPSKPKSKAEVENPYSVYGVNYSIADQPQTRKLNIRRKSNLYGLDVNHDNNGSIAAKVSDQVDPVIYSLPMQKYTHPAAANDNNLRQIESVLQAELPQETSELERKLA